MQYFINASTFQWINCRFLKKTGKLEQDLKYKGHVYFEQVLPLFIYQAQAYLKSLNKFYKERVSQLKKCSDFLSLLKFKGTEMSESINYTETGYASVENPLNIHRIVSNKSTLILRFQTYLRRRMLLWHQVQEKKKIQF